MVENRVLQPAHAKRSSFKRARLNEFTRDLDAEEIERSNFTWCRNLNSIWVDVAFLCICFYRRDRQ